MKNTENKITVTSTFDMFSVNDYISFRINGITYVERVEEKTQILKRLKTKSFYLDPNYDILKKLTKEEIEDYFKTKFEKLDYDLEYSKSCGVLIKRDDIIKFWVLENQIDLGDVGSLENTPLDLIKELQTWYYWQNIKRN